MTRASLLALLLAVSPLLACSGGEGEAAAPPSDRADAAPAPGGDDVAALDCVSGPLYAALADHVVAHQAILGRRPAQDTYETPEEFAPRLAAWDAEVRASADSLAAARPPIVLRGEVASHRYDEAAATLVVEDFGDLAVPGVVVDPAALLPYPALHCRTAPFFECARHSSDDAWRMEVVRNRVPLRTGREATLPVPPESAAALRGLNGPLAYEAVFEPVAPAAGEPVLPGIALRSLRLLAGDEVVARWEGEPGLAGRTTEQRMLSFVPEPAPPCPAGS